MSYNKDSDPEHAFLSPSNYHWLNYDEEKLTTVFHNYLAAMRGTETHKFAETCINRRQRLPRSKKTLNAYVNDAVGFNMTPEQKLRYSINCFGTADSIVFRNGLLRIHDLKTGSIPAHMEQLLIYAALFCLQNGIDPRHIDTELRIYQNDDIVIANPTIDDIGPVMNTIVKDDQIIEKIKKAEGLV